MVENRQGGSNFSIYQTGRGTAGLQFSTQDRPESRFFEKLEFLLAVGVVFFSPINVLRLDYFYFTLSDALTCLCLLLQLAQGRLSRQPLGPVSSLFWFAGLALLLVPLLLSSMINGDSMRGIVFVLQYTFAYLVILLVVAGRSEKQMIVLCKAYLLSIILMCLHGVYLIHFDGQTNTAFVTGSGRFTGFVERENECAAVIALSVPLLLVLCSIGKLSKLALIWIPVMGYGVMLTGSNTGLASFAFAIGAFVLFALNWKLIFGSGAVLFGIVVLIDRFGRDYLPAIFQRRVLGALETGDIGQAGTFDYRLELIYEAIHRANDTILLGIGADQYQVLSAMDQPVHNSYLLLWTEGGLFCMIGFIIMIAAGLGPAIQALRRPGGRPYAAGAICTVALFLMAVNAFANVYGRFWSVPVILAASLCYAFVARSDSAASQPRAR
jgi:hypothetical protein